MTEPVTMTMTKPEIERSISALADVLQWLNGFRAALPEETEKRLPTDIDGVRELNIRLKHALEQTERT